MPAHAPEPHLQIEALRRRLQSDAHEPTVDLIETHISWVLLAGTQAYKVKKPVKMGFLDFSTREARRHACLEELRLNQRLAPGLYIDVVAITGTPFDPRLAQEGVGGAEGEPIDYAVHMRRFPAGSLFSERLAAGRLQPLEVDRLAERIAEFHLRAPVADPASPYGTPELIESTTLQVFDALAQHEGAAALSHLRQWWQAQAQALRPAWQARRCEGRVREGHGDLHLANATLFEGDVLAFDCIEFDPQLRWIDVMSDMSFAAMDFMAHGRRDLAFRFLDGWLERTGDHAGLAVLPSDLVCRALVRALVGRLRQGSPCAGPDYLSLARRLAAPGAPRLLITHGVSGSGKTCVTQPLMEQAGAIRLRSDVERKRLYGLRPLERSDALDGQGIYSPEATASTYATLRDKARQSLQAGFPTIVDAAFLRRHERADFDQLARELGVPCTIVHCRADPAMLRERVARRLAGRQDASEADLAVLERQLAFQEPLTVEERRRTIEVDTAGGVDVGAVLRRWLNAG
jgi:aminoglycoside phosphotransferase family enzyme/predicted kinase